QDISGAKDPKEADVEVAKAAQSLIEFDLRDAGQRQHYFDNAPMNPDRANRDLLEFLLWRKKADKLGVTLSDEDAADLRNQEFLNRLTTPDWTEVEKSLSQLNGYTPAVLKE